MLSVAGPIVDLVLLRGLFTDTPLQPGHRARRARARARGAAGHAAAQRRPRAGAAAAGPARRATRCACASQEASPERIVLQVVQQGAPTPPPGRARAAARRSRCPAARTSGSIIEERLRRAGDAAAPRGRRSITAALRLAGARPARLRPRPRRRRGHATVGAPPARPTALARRRRPARRPRRRDRPPGDRQRRPREETLDVRA